METKNVIKWLKIVFCIIVLIVLSLCIIRLFSIIYHVLKLEFNYTYTWDSPIYWAVGRGYLNGITPYNGLFETKPPGIFLISAFSLLLTNDVLIGNIINGICLIFMVIVPVIFCIIYYKNEKIPIRILILFLSLVIGSSIMFFTSLRSGKYQVESYGSGFASLYLLVIVLINTKKVKWYSFSIILSGFFAMLSIMMKEPFLLIIIASSLLFIESFEDLGYKLFLPLVYGGIMGVIVMLVTNSLIPYCSIYLKHMLFSHVSTHGPLVNRIFKFDKIISDLHNYNTYFHDLIFGLIVFYLIYNLCKLVKLEKIRFLKRFIVLFNFAKFAVAIILVIISVALGGQFYNHHYAFASPFYLALGLFFIKKIKDFSYVYIRYAILSFAALLCILNILYYSPAVISFPSDVLNYNKDIREQAHYVDMVLDELGVDQYLQLGFNQVNKFYGLTRHSPLGPVFFQDPNNFKDENSWFVKEFIKQLDKAEVIIIDKKYGYNVKVINTYTRLYIESNFTLTEPKEIQDIDVPESFSIRYQIMFRIPQN